MANQRTWPESVEFEQLSGGAAIASVPWPAIAPAIQRYDQFVTKLPLPAARKSY